MSKQPNRHGPQKRRPQQRKGRTAMAAAKGGKSNRMTWLLVGGVLVIGIALIAAFAGKKKADASDYIKGEQDAPTSLVSKVTDVPESVITAVGSGSIQGPPTKITGTALESGDGKPRIVYIGSNYCPYSATERWAMVNALSRFGTFDNLKITSSAKTTPEGSPEVYPGTGTFSFSGSTFKSDYITFEPTEQFTNIVEGSAYKALDTTSPEHQALIDKYNKGGGIPFIDFANQFMISGASYKPEVLQGKTRDEIAGALKDESSDVTQGVVGTANVMTATICKVTGNKPANVCNNPTIQTIQSQLAS